MFLEVDNMAEMLGAWLMKQIEGGPKAPPPPPPYNPPPVPAAKKPENKPGNIPTSANSAVKKEEKRRIMAAAPIPTEKIFAGETDEEVSLKKQRILGGNPQTSGV
jgi:hypothetical protein